MPLVDLDLPCAAALHELVAKAALADPWLGDYADDLRVPGDRLLERRPQSGHLALATQELGEPARPRHLEPRPKTAEPLELVDAKGLLHPLDGELSEVVQRKLPSTSLAVCSVR